MDLRDKLIWTKRTWMTQLIWVTNLIWITNRVGMTKIIWAMKFIWKTKLIPMTYVVGIKKSILEKEFTWMAKFNDENDLSDKIAGNDIIDNMIDILELRDKLMSATNLLANFWMNQSVYVWFDFNDKIYWTWLTKLRVKVF